MGLRGLGGVEIAVRRVDLVFGFGLGPDLSRWGG